MRCLPLILVAAACASAPAYKNFKPEGLGPGQGVALGRVQVIYNGADITSRCAACFRSGDGPCAQLDGSGYVVMALEAGPSSLHHISCDANGRRQYDFGGTDFEIAPAARTYFGDVAIEWKDERAGRDSQFLGVVGGMPDPSAGNGEASLSVTDAQDATLAWYKRLVPRDDGLELRQSLIKSSPAH